MTDDELLRAFEDRTLPLDQWTHAAHVRVAVTYLRRNPFPQALDKMRAGINAYNQHHRIPDGPTSGYNETTTRALLHLIAATLAAYDQTFPTPTAQDFCETHPQLMTRHALRLFYSPQRRMHPLAKTRFVEPDLAPLPAILGPPPPPGPQDSGVDGSAIRLLTDALPPTPAMIDRLVEVCRQARQAHLQFLLDLHDAHEDREYLTRVVLPANRVWVAEVQGAVAGFIAAGAERVNHLYVAPEFQGRGLGSRLLDAARRGRPAMELWVFEDNAPAVRFYLRRGFQVVERTDGAGNEANRADLRMWWEAPAEPADPGKPAVGKWPPSQHSSS